MAEKLSRAEIEAKVSVLNQALDVPWQYIEGKLHKDFAFENFIQAFGFMTKVAMVAQAMNHHPEWSNIYQFVHVDLFTHDVVGITELDFTLAHKIERVLLG